MYWRNFLVAIFLFGFASGIFAKDLTKNNSNDYLDILSALNLEYDNPSKSIDSFLQLYKKTKSSIYLKEAFGIAYNTQDKRIADIMKIGDKVLSNDSQYNKTKALYFYSIADYDKSIKIAEKLLTKEKSAENYSLLALIQLKLRLYNSSLENLKLSYKLKNNETVALEIAKVYIDLNKFDEAIKQLEEYKKNQGCGNQVCFTLVNIYKMSRNFNKLIETYLSLYEGTNDNAYLTNAIAVCIYKKDYKQAIKIIEKYNYDKAVLAELYIMQYKDYTKAIKIVDEEFNRTNDYNFLALSAEYDFQKNIKNPSKETLKRICDKFEKSVYKLNKPLFYNDYGYLLIDYNLDIKKGIELAKQALKNEPNSIYYLDTLAWGYYKLKNCSMAKETLNKIKNTSAFNDLEFKKHFDAIKKCKK